MSEQYWGVCQTAAGREHMVRAKIEAGDRGAFLPTIAKTWVADGKLSAGERPALAGYVFFRTGPRTWPAVEDIEGVQQVLTLDVPDGDNVRRVAKRVTDVEMARLVLGHATGAHNSIGASIYTGKRRDRVRRRRPRPGKRIRKATVSNRTDI